MNIALKIGLGIMLASSVSVSAIAQQSTAPTPKAEKTTEPLTANSSTELKKKFMGKHIDKLPEATTSTKAVQNGNEVVCKKIKKTGSRLGARKVCATKKEWDQHKTDARRNLQNKQVTRNQGD